MKKELQIILIILGLCVLACKQTIKEPGTQGILKIINTLNVSPSYKYLIILPGTGCGDCVKTGEEFMQNHIGQSDILFVLTQIESLKMLQNRLGITLKNHQNVYIDRDHTLSIMTNNRYYPCIIYLEKGQLKKHEFQSPKNLEAFQRLEGRL
ncbi:hypothetical protein PW52_07925 [Tamlana sedimentorum]|uniref:Alkyl hydroperoxide reductase subunit C/ Thiol specific antioxidant domain-containing protein n=1 Tax=Neotamlana sedimentorum TaxID=1435349 RepID=A0A0D7W999_9FLAO|nr:hypothetical protein [Tamlana sedimentorum]KJD35664.1 hypothetical protein PW52_07925 [Tamlana sedimentorum]